MYLQFLKDILFDPKSWLITAITLISYKIIRFYWITSKYPPGPRPLPLIGNILGFLRVKQPLEFLFDLQRYGNLATFYLGPIPNVVIFDLELARQAYGHKDFAGRPQFNFNEAFLGRNAADVIFSDYGRTWEVLRRVAYAAVRKYSVSDHLPVLVADVVDEVVEVIKKDHNDKPFDVKEYIYLMVYNIIAQSAYGKRYSINDPEFIQLKDDTTKRNQLANKLIVAEFVPITKFTLFRSAWKSFNEAHGHFRQFLIDQYQMHKKTFDPSTIRDFADALISAKQEAIIEESDSIEQLTDDNLALVLMDLFMAGTDTTRQTFEWMVLFLANWPEIQDKVRSEVEEVLGDSILDQNRRTELNYCQAFISESLRFRNVTAIGVLHKTTSDTTIGGYRIPKGTAIHLMQHPILNDSKYWEKPEKFNPHRFLDSQGHHSSRSMKAFIPFSLGRRACPGEKLALADLLFMLVRFIQATKNHRIELENGPGSVSLNGSFESNVMVAQNYKITLRSIK